MSIILTKDTDIITLPSPDWNDSKNIIASMTLHQSMDKDYIYTYKKTSDKQLLIFTISNIDYLIVLDLIDFMIEHAGEEIELKDWNNDDWEGVILTNPLSFVTEKRGIEFCEIYDNKYEQEGVSITLEFEGIISG